MTDLSLRLSTMRPCEGLSPTENQDIDKYYDDGIPLDPDYDPIMEAEWSDEIDVSFMMEAIAVLLSGGYNNDDPDSKPSPPSSPPSPCSSKKSHVTTPQTSAMSGNGEQQHSLGRDIVRRMPGSLHFIVGISNFDVNPSDPADPVVDNAQFKEIVNNHFRGKLQDEAFRRSLLDPKTGKVTYRVTKELEPILQKAKMAPLTDPTRQDQRIDDFRIWVKTGKEPLQEGTWKDTIFQDITTDHKVVKDMLTRGPLRTELTKLFNHATTSKPCKKRKGGRQESICARTLQVNADWYVRLPKSNLPLAPNQFEAQVSPLVVHKLTTRPALVLVDSHQRHGYAEEVAIQYARSWMWDATTKCPGRFCLYMDATDETTLRASYYEGIERVTFSDGILEEQNLDCMETQLVADRLLGLLERKGELCGHQWIMIFANVQPIESFHSMFFSAKSNWWNPGRGKFLIAATSSNNTRMTRVCVDHGSHGRLVPVDSVLID